MSKLEVFKQFAAKSRQENVLTSNAVIYTRVSSKEQDDNTSLEYQKRTCEEYAKRKGYSVVAYFGGTYESAKTDERKEFNRMLKFLRESKGKVSRIIVLSMERFSRSGGNAIYLKDKLRASNIFIESATQETDGSTISGDFQQNMYLLFGKMENELRKQKTLAGMQEMMRKGYLPNRAPIGYRHVPGVDWDNRIVIDEKKGPLIRKAFEMKANEGKSNTEIAEFLQNAGLALDRKRLSDILKNPFYCGVLANGYLPGEVYQGKHPKLISEELFLKANEVDKKKRYGQRQQKVRQEFPLKQFVKCDHCGTPMTAYHVKRKKATYYKCNKIGCKVNRNSAAMHDKLLTHLAKYQAKPEHENALKRIMVRVFNRLNASQLEQVNLLKIQLEQVESNIKKLTDKFVADQIGKAAYDEALARYTGERKKITQEMQTCSEELSNLEEYIDYSIERGRNLPSLWTSGDLHEKQELQSQVFPEGLRFNKEIDDYRTCRVHTFFHAIDFISSRLAQKKSGTSESEIENSALVAPTGIEPVSKV